MEQTLVRIDVVSLAKVVGAIGFLWGIILAIIWLVTGVLGGPLPGIPELVIPVVGGLLSGIIVGGITAILYNAATSRIGGLVLEFDG